VLEAEEWQAVVTKQFRHLDGQNGIKIRNEMVNKVEVIS
jgi:hypothetical protein